MVKKVGNLIPNTFFITKGSGESDLEKHAGSYHMALYDAGISDFNIMTYSSVIPATAHLATMDELDLPPFGSEMKTIMAVSHGYQDEFVSAGEFTHGCIRMRTLMRRLVALCVRSADVTASRSLSLV